MFILFLNFILTILLGIIITNHLSINIPKFSKLFFAIPLGAIGFTATSYLFSLLFSFPTGLIISYIFIGIFEFVYFLLNYKKLEFINLLGIVKEPLLLVILLLSLLILFPLFHTHIILDIDGDLYTGESTFGDLPFHLSTISQISYANKFPPQNPMYDGLSLVYPYLANFQSAILVLGGSSLRDSIFIPGIILSLALIALFYDFVFALTKNSLKSFIATILYFLNGGLGFYFFLKDNNFHVPSIITSIINPTTLKEYSHLFEQNIQWPNFLSRMIVPERSLLFGIPAGLIILRLLYFRNSINRPTLFDLIVVSALLALMPLLHTHTALVMAIILPILSIFSLKKNSWKEQVFDYAFVVILTLILLAPQYQLFLGHLGGSGEFFRAHAWWMKDSSESVISFWFKNSYLLILFSLAVFIPRIGNSSVKILEICALILLALVNIFLFQPYNWDNVKLLLWAGVFFSISMSVFLCFILSKRKLVLDMFVLVIILTSIATALLSIYREINVKYMLFSKDSVELGNYIKENTPINSKFLTYKVHHSPASNLGGRSILMGYPGLLWVHGIDYSKRDKDINLMYAGASDELFNEYEVNFVIVGPGIDKDIPVNTTYLNKFPVFYKNNTYVVYQIK